TSPMNPKGMLVFGAGAGLLCAVIRLWGSYPEGCSYSILIMNAFVPLINKYFKPARYGREVNFG
ncbi:MAG TPA: RnfABCDGE type electron transport complex subunit D, partial [Spirochaetota bacterium]|nr:RnfABCDGE type electron transport complex subunit D [Spirochaetota bacterium]